MDDASELDLAHYLETQLAEVASDLSRVGIGDLRELWTRLYPHPTAESEAGYEAFEEALVSALRSEGQRSAELEFRPGGWELDLRSGVVKFALTAAILSGVLVAAGATGLAPIVLPAIIPMLLDVKKVRISPRDRALLAELLNFTGQNGLPSQELYDRLPAEVREAVSRLDFVDFIDKLHRAGYAAKGEGDRVLVHPANEPRFRLNLD